MLQQLARGRATGPRLTKSGRPPPDERLVFGRTGWAIDFTDCGAAVSGIKQVLRGWNLRSGSPSSYPSSVPRGHIVRTASGWTWHELGAPRARDWDRVPPRDVMRVITDVHDAALYWYLAENPELLCLHGAAARIGDGLVCFPARGRTGKSTLMACLAASGHTIYSDDVLGLDGRIGVALGFLPRLRAPLAPALTRTTSAYVRSHMGPNNKSWIYLNPGAQGIASHGMRSKISSFIVLDRQDSGKAAFAQARTADILKLLISENIIRQLPMPAIFERLHDLAVASEKLVLSYSDPQDAARLLERRYR